MTGAAGRLLSALFTILGVLLALVLGVPIYYGVVAAAAAVLLLILISDYKRRKGTKRR
jgi:Flp pilus assembly protein TadB